MAKQCLFKLAEVVEKNDMMIFCDAVKEFMQLQKHKTITFESTKLPMRKWCSNLSLAIST